MCEFRVLRADEIEVRISMVKTSGVQVLLYKDARCDMNILDEAVGCLNWKREHTRDNANCIVSIWDDSKKQWVSKEDTGTESNTEALKGIASDSFKRACTNWGIGRELYTSPFCWFNANECKIEGTKCYDRFEVIKIEYEGRKIKGVVIGNKTTGIIKCFGQVTDGVETTPAITSAPRRTTKKAENKASEVKTEEVAKKKAEAVKDGNIESVGNIGRLIEACKANAVPEEWVARKCAVDDIRSIPEGNVIRILNNMTKMVEMYKAGK